MSSPAQTPDLRARIESGFASWARIATRHRWLVVVVGLGVALGFASRIPQLTVNNSTDAFLAPDDPIRVEYDAFREQFGLDTRITFAIESDSIFTLEFLEHLRRFHVALEESVPHIDEMTSLINARDTYGDGDTLVVGDLLEDWPQTEADLQRIRERALANPLYRDTLISQDGTLTTISITLDAFASDESAFDALEGFGDETEGDLSLATPSGLVYLPVAEQERAVATAREVAEAFERPGFHLHVAGSPVLTATLNGIMIRDVVRSAAGCLAMVAIFLALLFRRIEAVILPVFVVVASLTTTLGLVQLSGAHIGFGTQILPSFLMAVGVCDSVHILAIYYLARQGGADKEDAIAYALGHSSLPILMTSLTTAGGLASFISADLAPVQELGVFAPIGVLFAFAYTVFLMPAMMAIAPMGAPAARRESSDRGWLDRALRATGAWSARHRLAVITATLAIVVFSGVGASFIRMSHDPMEWLPETDEFRESTLLMNRRLGGVNALEVVVRYDDDDAIHEPDRLATHAASSSASRAATRAARCTSARPSPSSTCCGRPIRRSTRTTPPTTTSPTIGASWPRSCCCSRTRAATTWRSSSTPRFSMARISLRVPWVNTLHYPRVVRMRSAERRPGADRHRTASIRITGLVAMLSRTFDHGLQLR